MGLPAYIRERSSLIPGVGQEAHPTRAFIIFCGAQRHPDRPRAGTNSEPGTNSQNGVGSGWQARNIPEFLEQSFATAEANVYRASAMTQNLLFVGRYVES